MSAPIEPGSDEVMVLIVLLAAFVGAVAVVYGLATLVLAVIA